MELLETIKNKLVKKNLRAEFCLQSIRLRKMVTNVYQIIQLFEDGHDKIQGAYILDSHYTSSLAESILEKIGELVFDANVIMEKEGENLYRVYDQYQDRVQKTLLDLSKSVENREKLADSFEQEPEYQTLNTILNWWDQKNSDQIKTVKEVIALVFKHAAIKMNDIPKMLVKKTPVGFSSGKARHKVLIVNLNENETYTEEFSESNWECKPLSYLLSDVQSSEKLNPEKGSLDTISWLAAIEKNNLSLFLLEGITAPIHIEAFRENKTGLNMIFAFIDQKIASKFNSDTIFFKEQVGAGQILLFADSNLNHFESNLKKIGRIYLS